jgi:lipopolysaccharide export system protein LptC
MSSFAAICRRGEATFAEDFPLRAPYDRPVERPILQMNGGKGMGRPITASAIDGPRGWHATGRGNLERTVRSAGRHSRIVRVVRVGIPAAIVIALGSYVGVTYFNPLGVLASVPSVSGKLAVQGSKITMELPKIAGITRDQRSYQLTAETAVQDILKPDQVELQNLRAEMEMAGADMVVITAKSGTYNTKGDRVVLREHVVVTSSQGYKAKLREAVVDMKKGNVVSEQPVEVKMPSGLINANGMEVENSGEVVRFTRGVVFDMDAEEPPNKEPAKK